MSTLLGQGLVITVIGMGLVFAALALLWLLISLLGRVSAAPEPTPGPGGPGIGAEEAPGPTDTATEALSAERAQVAALVAGALMANALPLLLEAPAGPTFEHGRTAPIWVSANRARTLYSWQPRRSAEVSAME